MRHRSKEITREEAKYLFLRDVANMVTFWENNKDCPSTRGELEGLLFSVLAAIDGT